MQDALMLYFDGEKYAGLFLAGLGAVSIAAAAVLFPARLNLRSFAVTLIVLAVAEIALGVGLYLRTGPQVSRLVGQLASDPQRFYAEEGPRMQRVQRNFVVIEWVELAIIIIAAMLAVTQKNRPGLTGIALALIINGTLLLAFDLIAERRGAAYLSAIERQSSFAPRA